MKCPKCGKENNPEYLFCESCGYKLQNEDELQRKKQELKQKQRMAFLKFRFRSLKRGIVILFVLVIFSVIVEMCNDDTKTDQNTDKAYEENITEETNKGSLTPLEKLRSVADENKCDKEIIESSFLPSSIGDDGSYYDEVILDTWTEASKKIQYLYAPETLDQALRDWIEYDYRFLQYYHFINGEDVSITDVKRSVEENWYAIVLLDIEKLKDSDDDVYFQGKDPISDEYVVVQGNTDKILNGDSVLVFGVSMGTSSDDTLNIHGVYTEIITDRIKGLF